MVCSGIFGFDIKRVSRACAVVFVLQAATFSKGDCASARNLLETFLPQGPDACDSFVQSSCTLLLEPAARTDTCSQQNAQQMANDVQDSDSSQACTWQLKNRQQAQTAQIRTITAERTDLYSDSAGCCTGVLRRLHHKAVERWNSRKQRHV